MLTKVRHANIYQSLIVSFAMMLGTCALAHAQNAAAPENGFSALGLKSPKTILDSSLTDKGFFGGRFDGSIEHLGDGQEKQVDAPAAVDAESEKQKIAKVEDSAPNGSAPAVDLRSKILGRVDQKAPEPFQDMVYNFRSGDSEGAQRSAGSYVDYLTDLMFELRVYSKMIGEAFVQRKMIEEDEWYGVEGILNWTLAKSRSGSGNPLRMTHEAAMKRIQPDPKHQVEVYYFFSLSSKYSRDMAPDVERLWRAVKDDPNVKMVGVTMGAVPQRWMHSYREYTGLTLPIFNGEELAKKFNVALVPAVVVVSPNLNKAYLKSGQQELNNLYEFVRTAQGLSTEVSPQLQRLANLPIGELERSTKAVRVVGVTSGRGVGNAKNSKATKMEKF